MSLLVSMFIWVLVYAGLPIALFAVGVAHNDVLHAMYVAYVLKILWVGVFEFVPKFERRANLLEIFTAGTVSQHTVLRVYAALHVLVMFAFKMPTLW